MSSVVNISATLVNTSTLSFTATATAGTYIGVLTSRGLQYVVSVVVANTPDTITVDNIFQANALHTLRIYESDGETLLDDTIYNITTNAVASTQVRQVIDIEVETTDGMTSYTNGVLKGAQSATVFFEGTLMHGTTWTPASDTITLPYPVDSKQRMLIKVAK